MFRVRQRTAFFEGITFYSGKFFILKNVLAVVTFVELQIVFSSASDKATIFQKSFPKTPIFMVQGAL